MATRYRNLLLLMLGVLALSGCTTTRLMRMGPLTGDEMLVTLVVTEDHAVVAHECDDVRTTGHVLGCQKSWPVAMNDKLPVRAVKIVRYTDAVPSRMAMEIDVHELCHAIAALQLMKDPCHVGNDGQIQAAVPDSTFTR